MFPIGFSVEWRGERRSTVAVPHFAQDDFGPTPPRGLALAYPGIHQKLFNVVAPLSQIVILGHGTRSPTASLLSKF